MFSKTITIAEINSLFASIDDMTEKPQIVDLKDLFERYKKGGQNGLGGGLSYPRAIDCLFYLILTDDNIEHYASCIRGKKPTTIKESTAGFLARLKPKDTRIRAIDWDFLDKEKRELFSQSINLGRLLECLENEFIIPKNGENAPLDEEQKSVLRYVIGQLCDAPLERYLTRESEFHNKKKSSVKLSWCREERQIALFLYSLLLEKKRNKNYKICNKEIEKVLSCIFGAPFDMVIIDQVYYEAAIIRDYFHSLNDERRYEFDRELLRFCINDKEKDDFINKLLKEYCGVIIRSGESEGNLKQKGKYLKKDGIHKKGEKVQEYNIYSRQIHFACMMMNAKPDILVVYHSESNRIRRAKILECKYESDPDYYKDYKGKKTVNQKLIQELIMTFLFGYNEAMDKLESPTKYYCGDCKKVTTEWLKKYGFCDEILKNHIRGRKGIMNDGIDEKNIIINSGVTEVDFKSKGHYSANDNKRVYIPAELLINHVYF